MKTIAIETAIHEFQDYAIKVAKDEYKDLDTACTIFEGDERDSLDLYLRGNLKDNEQARYVVVECLTYVSTAGSDFANDYEDMDDDHKRSIRRAMAKLNKLMSECNNTSDDGAKTIPPLKKLKKTSTLNKIGKKVLEVNAKAGIQTLAKKILKDTRGPLSSLLVNSLPTKHREAMLALLQTEHGEALFSLLLSFGLPALPLGAPELQAAVAEQLQVNAAVHVQSELVEHVAEPLLKSLKEGVLLIPQLLEFKKQFALMEQETKK